MVERNTIPDRSGALPFVLHVSADFPDPIEPAKTPVIRSLVDLTGERFDHQVVSLNRVSPGASLSAVITNIARTADPLSDSLVPFEYGHAAKYVAPGMGLFHKTMLGRLGDALVEHVKTLAKKPDLLVAHKLTIEGIAVSRAAKTLGIPFALTIQGNTDRKILAARPDLRGVFRKTLQEAASITTFTPVARDSISASLRVPPDRIRLVPCPTELDTILKPRSPGDGLISVFHLRNHKVKNLKGMTRAMRLGEGSDHIRSLSIIGGGSDREKAKCASITKQVPGIAFEGRISRGGMAQRMNAATALVQPSLTESFGLVFIEALFAGLPIIYPAKTAIDGYFDGADFAIRVDSRSPNSIREAMQEAMLQESRMKLALAEWQESSHARQFTRSSIAQKYGDALSSALERRHRC